MLTDTLIRNTKPNTKTIKFTDGAGLYLERPPQEDGIGAIARAIA